MLVSESRVRPARARWYMVAEFRPIHQTYNCGVTAMPTEQDRPLRSLRGRRLGFDVGSKTVGMAVSDPLGSTAEGLNTRRRKNKKHDFEQLAAVIQQYAVQEIV